MSRVFTPQAGSRLELLPFQCLLQLVLQRLPPAGAARRSRNGEIRPSEN